MAQTANPGMIINTSCISTFCIVSDHSLIRGGAGLGMYMFMGGELIFVTIDNPDF